MGIKLLDNLLKIYTSKTAFTGVTLVSTEMDFDIPRGFVVKIHTVILEIVRIGEDIEGISADKLYAMQVCIVKDPDDLTTVQIPSNRVDHDVLIDLECEVLIVANAADTSLSMRVSPSRVEYNFSGEGVDVITARNMRMNIDAFGTDSADVTEAVAQGTIHYTLERITDVDILALLDIL